MGWGRQPLPQRDVSRFVESGCQDVEILKMVDKKTSLSNMNEALSYDGENFQEYFEGEEFTIGLHLKFIQDI